MLRTPTINRAPDESSGPVGDSAPDTVVPEKGKQQESPQVEKPQSASKDDQQYKGLVDKNSELLGEVKSTKKQLSSLLDELGGEDGVNEIREMRRKAAESEDYALMQQGKADVLREKWVKQTAREYERKLHGLQTVASEKEQVISTLSQRLQREIIGNQVRSAAGKIKEFAETATDDAVIIALRVFATDENGVPVGRDESGAELYGKDGKLMSIREWLESQVDNRPHWFYSDGGTGMRPMSALHGAIKMSRAEARSNPIAWAQERRKAEKSGREIVIVE